MSRGLEGRTMDGHICSGELYKDTEFMTVTFSLLKLHDLRGLMHVFLNDRRVYGLIHQNGLEIFWSE